MARKSKKQTAPSQAVAQPSVAPTPSDAMPVIVPLPINKDAKTFFDLPGEIRNQIYCELLPDVAVSALRRGSFRKDGSTTSATFLATCKAIYAEASSILQGPIRSTKDVINITVSLDGGITFLGHHWTLENATAAHFTLIKHFENIHLDVRTGSSWNLASLCLVQDAVFTLLKGNLRTGHDVQSIRVTVYTPGPSESYYRMREFRNVHPGDVSRAHIAAFLSDPLRMIRGLPGSKNAFSFDFAGKSGRPWRNIEGEVHGLMYGKTAVQDFDIFRDYFIALRKLDGLCDIRSTSNLVYVLERLALSRVRGNVKFLSQWHVQLVKAVNDLCNRALDPKLAMGKSDAQRLEVEAREKVYLCEELTRLLPHEDADTSFFGYNIADNALREWQTHGREEEKEARAERKRKREEAAEAKAGKKTKTSKSD